MALGCTFSVEDFAGNSKVCIKDCRIECKGSEEEKRKCPLWFGNYLYEIKEILRLRMK